MKMSQNQAEPSRGPGHARRLVVGAVIAVTALLLSTASPTWAEPTEDVSVPEAEFPDTDLPETTQPPISEEPPQPPAPEPTVEPDESLLEASENEAQAEPGADPSEQAEESEALAPLHVGAEALSKRLAVAPLGVINDKPNKRVSGSDRFATAVAISKHSYKTAPTVIVATGMNYPDSLSAAPLAAKLRAPLLLTLPGSLPKATRDEIKRLKPQSIIIVGGNSAVNGSVANALKALAPKVERLSGGDRYATSVAISKRGWSTGPSNAFIATGEGYADALSAGAAAGKLGIPVVLVPGSKSSPPIGVERELKRLDAKRLFIAGGTRVVSSSMEKALAPGSKVTRYSGTDRFATSARIASGVFTGSTRSVYLANGLDFADALTGAAAAGAESSPLLLTLNHCIPSEVYSAADARKANETMLLGGAMALGDSVRNGNECMRKPSGISSNDWSSLQKTYSYINYYRYISGRAAARVSDAAISGTPAHTWSKRGSVTINSNLAKSQKWVRYEGVVRSRAGGDRAKAIYNRFMKEPQAKQWIHRPTGGNRTFVSIGYHTSGSYSYSTVYVGTGLK